jgi:hypothetical protein
MRPIVATPPDGADDQARPEGRARPIDHIWTETEFESVVIATPFTAFTT